MQRKKPEFMRAVAFRKRLCIWYKNRGSGVYEVVRHCFSFYMAFVYLSIYGSEPLGSGNNHGLP